MITKIKLKYLEYEACPIMKSSEREKHATDEYGDCACPFCDMIVKSEGNILKIGDKCWKCKAEVVRFEKR